MVIQTNQECWQYKSKRLKHFCSDDVLGVSELKTKKFKGVENIGEEENNEEKKSDLNAGDMDLLDKGISQRPSVWYFHEIEMDKRKRKMTQSELRESRTVATQTEDNGNGSKEDIDIRMANLEKSVSLVLLELRYKLIILNNIWENIF